MGVMHDNEETCCLGRTDARAHSQRTVDFVTLDCHRQISSCLTHKPNPDKQERIATKAPRPMKNCL